MGAAPLAFAVVKTSSVKSVICAAALRNGEFHAPIFTTTKLVTRNRQSSALRYESFEGADKPARISHRRSNFLLITSDGSGSAYGYLRRHLHTTTRGLAMNSKIASVCATAQAEVRFTSEALSGATAAEARRETTRCLRDKPIAGRTTRDTCCASARAVCALIQARADHFDPRVPNCGIPCPCSLRRLWPRGGPELSRGRWA